MCNYWYLILTLQVDFLLYFRSTRESDFQLYIFSIKNLMKWIFAFGHCHYERWGIVHLFDLMNLHHTCPDIYRNFISGNFSFQKSYQQFSKMGLDQVHEQNNKKIKGVSGATHLINRNDMPFMERWETSSPEIAKSHTGHDFDITEKPHHEDIVAFLNGFSLDVKKVIEGRDVNPSLQDDLMKISHALQVYDHQVHLTLQTLLINGETQFGKFLNDQLIN